MMAPMLAILWASAATAAALLHAPPPLLTARCAAKPPSPRRALRDVVLFAATPPPPTPQTSFDELFKTGSDFVASGDLDLAMGCFLRAQALDPLHAPTNALVDKLKGLGIDVDVDLADIERELALDTSEDEDKEGDGADAQKRVDAALAELGRTGGDQAAAATAGGFGGAAAAAATGDAEEDLAPSADLLPGARIVVAGAETAIGRRLLRAVGTAGFEGIAAPPKPTAAALADADAVIIVSAAAGGKGGIDAPEMAALVAAVPDGVTRLVYLGVHGVERVNQLPYSMQNVFGQLDKLRAAEQEVLLRALKRIPSCSVVRVAQIKEEGGDDARCELAPGDALQGAVAASAVEAVLVQSLQRAEAVNASFSVGFASGAALAGPAASIADADVHWDDEFVRLVGPEIYRRPLARAGLDRAVEWVRLWARDFLKDGMRLTTPVELENVDGGVILRFLQPGGVGYDLDFDQEETAEMKYAAAKAASKEGRARSRGTADGALVVVAEAEPYVRVRVTRAEMGEGVVVKEMSEQTVLERLDKGLAALDK